MVFFSKIKSIIDEQNSITEKSDYYKYSRSLIDAVHKNDYDYIRQQINFCINQGLKIPFHNIINESLSNNRVNIIKKLFEDFEGQLSSYNYEQFLNKAIKYGKDGLIRHFLFNDSIIKKINFNNITQNFLLPALIHNHTNIALYILNHEQLKNKIDLHIEDDLIFRTVFNNEQIDVLTHLVDKCRLPQTKTIKNILYYGGSVKSNFYNSKVRAIFNNHDLPLIVEENFQKIIKKHQFKQKENTDDSIEKEEIKTIHNTFELYSNINIKIKELEQLFTSMNEEQFENYCISLIHINDIQEKRNRNTIVRLRL